MYKKILAAYDGSEGAKVALERACDVAKEFSAVITMAWVRSPLPHYAADIGEVEDEKEAADDYFEQLRRDAMTAAASRGISIDCVCLKGNAAREIVQFADKEKYDLIVIGQVGHSDFIGRVLGPTADRISETARCDVLIARKPG